MSERAGYERIEHLDQDPSVVPLSEQGGRQRPIPPVDHEAEQALLSALLANNAAYDDVCDMLRADDFSDGAHERIYRAIAALIERGDKADALTLKRYFDQDDSLDSVGGAQYLAELQAVYMPASEAQQYAGLIRDARQRCDLMQAAGEAIDSASKFDPEVSGEQLVERLEERLYALQERPGGDRTVRLVDATHRWLDQVERARQNDRGLIGVTTGLVDLDRAVGGLVPGWQMIVAGRPGMGKTALGLNLAVNAARLEGAGVAFFSLEMTADLLAPRILAAETGISPERQQARVDDDELVALSEGGHAIAHLPVFIDDTPGLSIAQLRSKIRRLRRRHDIKIVIIDYIQLMQPTQETRRKYSDTAEVGEISKGLRAVTNELNVCMVGLAQLSREVEKRTDKRPIMADLRQSGQIEQDADVVIFPYRRAYYLEKERPEMRSGETDEQFHKRLSDWEWQLERCRNTAEAILGKHRHRPGNRTARLHWDGNRQTFGNLYQDGEEGLFS